ncbi:MAG: triose-phosphate isomerase [Selenomonadaceae bacterium]|nr:triose-phosphate isomerase [Selenomonadaceae bacterium]
MKYNLTPFLVVNPKSYLYGEKSLALAKAADEAAEKYGLTVFFTCPFADIRLIAGNTKDVVVTAQHMESLRPGRGMGHVLPESLKEAGAGAVFLNHAENSMTVAELCKTIKRAKELEMLTIVCADSVAEGLAIAEFHPDILLCEPTDLIGTGQTADDSYVLDACEQIRRIDPKIAVMIASGVTTAEDCYRVVKLGADGTGATSGILKAPDPAVRVHEMAEAIVRAFKERK